MGFNIKQFLGREEQPSSAVMRRKIERTLADREAEAERERMINDASPEYEWGKLVDSRVLPLLTKLYDINTKLGNAMVAVREAEEAVEELESEKNEVRDDMFKAVHAFMGIAEEREFTVTGTDERAKVYLFTQSATKARKLKMLKDLGLPKYMSKESRKLLAEKAGIDIADLQEQGDGDDEGERKMGFTLQ